jgi:hypothetical protein
MGSLDDETFPEPLLSLSLDDDEHNHSSTLNSDSKVEDGSNQTTNAGSSCSTSSTKSSMKKMFHKQFNMASTPAYDKRQVMKKKSQSYQDLHLPSIRRRYSNVQSKVKLYIDSIQPPKIGGNQNTKRTPLLRHKSMPETYQNLMQDEHEMMSPETVKQCNLDHHAELEEYIGLERDLESTKHENLLLCKKVDDMRITIEQLKAKQLSVPNLSVSRKVVNRSMRAVATQTDLDLDETNTLAYELSATTSVKSFTCAESSGIADNNLLVDDSPKEVAAPKRRKKSSYIRKKFRKMFSCIEVGVD